MFKLKKKFTHLIISYLPDLRAGLPRMGRKGWSELINKNRFLPLIIFIIHLSTNPFIHAKNNVDRIHIIFTNDLRGAIQYQEAPFINPEFAPRVTGGAAALKYVREVREEASKNGEGLLVLDGGNIFQGNPLGTRDGGETIIKWMNQMGYDAMTVGNYDFDQGVENVRKLSKLAEFPFLGGNILDESTGRSVDFCTPYMIKDVFGTRVAIIGVTTSSMPEITIPETIAGLEFEKELPYVKKAIEQVKTQGADIVILLAHLGLPYDIEEKFEEFVGDVSTSKKDWNSVSLNAMELAHFMEGVDVIITGHITKGYNEPWEDPVSHALCFQSYGSGTSIGHIILNIDQRTGKMIGYDTPSERGALITLFDDDFHPDFDGAHQIEGWRKTAQKHVSEPVNLPTSKRTESLVQDKWAIPSFGSDSRLEIATWNIEFFPKAGDTTIAAMAEVINDLNVDIIGIQEIGKRGSFAKMMALIPEYDYVLSQSSSFFDQAIIYKKEFVTALSQKDLFTFEDYWFAGRPPLQGDFIWSNGRNQFPVSVIDIHMKCCDDGIFRRSVASKMLADYIKEKITDNNSNILVVGDWNDEIDDPWHKQSLNPFVEDKENFYFTTIPILYDPTQFSYPSWPSFLDHILISENLFDENNSTGITQTIRLQDYVGGWDEYERILSDHLPVVWSISFDNEAN